MRKKQSAFPINGGSIHPDYTGLTIRDYFAGQFIIAILSHQHMIPSDESDLEGFCKMAYRAADTMIDERDKSDA